MFRKRKKVVTLEEVKKNAKVVDFGYKHILFWYGSTVYAAHEGNSRPYPHKVSINPTATFEKGVYEVLNETRPKPSDLAILVGTKAKDFVLRSGSSIAFKLGDYKVEMSTVTWNGIGKAAKLDKYLKIHDKAYIVEELLEVATANKEEKEKQEKEELLKWLRSL